jgi:hypothetical protein
MGGSERRFRVCKKAPGFCHAPRVMTCAQVRGDRTVYPCSPSSLFVRHDH